MRKAEAGRAVEGFAVRPEIEMASEVMMGITEEVGRAIDERRGDNLALCRTRKIAVAPRACVHGV
jgi:hypothetical protein